MRTTITVQNLKCGGCAHTITTKIASIENVTDVSVNQENASVSFMAITPEAALTVKNKLKTLGYPSIEEENNIVSKAKSFVSCATGKISK